MAAALIDIDQPRMSDLRNGRLTRFSLEKLIRCASRLGAEFHFTVTWDRRKRFLAARAKTAAEGAEDAEEISTTWSSSAILCALCGEIQFLTA